MIVIFAVGFLQNKIIACKILASYYIIKYLRGEYLIYSYLQDGILGQFCFTLSNEGLKA